ncbi:hypothetical protein TGFOU_217555B, partial [Toxoplasma gondii FOU]
WVPLCWHDVDRRLPRHGETRL